ncbi:MAG: hypothetical protein JWO88_2526 [Frankiales bacterium]|nr:hypothetical protein [Frankiales bacterium]
MLWVLLDVLIGLLALAGLGVVLLGLWRKVKDLGREVGRAGEAIGQATQKLADLQAQLPPRG